MGVGRSIDEGVALRVPTDNLTAGISTVVDQEVLSHRGKFAQGVDHSVYSD